MLTKQQRAPLIKKRVTGRHESVEIMRAKRCLLESSRPCASYYLRAKYLMTYLLFLCMLSMIFMDFQGVTIIRDGRQDSRGTSRPVPPTNIRDIVARTSLMDFATGMVVENGIIVANCITHAHSLLFCVCVYELCSCVMYVVHNKGHS